MGVFDLFGIATALDFNCWLYTYGIQMKMYYAHQKGLPFNYSTRIFSQIA